jgi:cytochrome P450
MTFDPWLPFRPERAEADLQSIHLLQSECPVKQRDDGAWLVTSADGVRQVLGRIEDFGGTFGDYSDVDPDDVILPGLGEPLHTMIRRGVNASVAYQRSVTVKPYLRDLVTQLVGEALAECESKGSSDIYLTVLLPVPASVIAHLLGVPMEDRWLFTKWGDELCEIQLEGDNFRKPVGELHPEFAAYLDRHIEMRKADGGQGEDSISRMMRVAVQEDQPMSDRMIRTQLMNLLVAGNETTRNLLGSLFYRLASDQEFHAEIRADRSLIPNFIEETLRLESPVRFVVRRCPQGAHLGDAELTPDSTVLVSLEAANHDPGVWGDPDDFDVRRTDAKDHLAFGAGRHICPGAFLARLEAELVLETYLDLIETTKLVEGVDYVPNPVYWARGPITLPVVLQAATTSGPDKSSNAGGATKEEMQ